MDAYQQGLTGKAAEWVVQKQKSRWTASDNVHRYHSQLNI